MKLPRKVYAIQHNVTKRIYIGSSGNVEKRYKHHISQLRSGKHHIEDMQDDFIKYGEDYSFYIIDEITRFEDRRREYEWMLKYESYIRGKGYNYKDVGFANAMNKTVIPYKEGLPVMNN